MMACYLLNRINSCIFIPLSRLNRQFEWRGTERTPSIHCKASALTTSKCDTAFFRQENFRSIPITVNQCCCISANHLLLQNKSICLVSFSGGFTAQAVLIQNNGALHYSANQCNQSQSWRLRSSKPCIYGAGKQTPSRCLEYTGRSKQRERFNLRVGSSVWRLTSVVAWWLA